MSTIDVETEPRLKAPTDPIESGQLKASRWSQFLGGTAAGNELLISFQVNYPYDPNSTLAHQAFMQTLGYELSDEDCVKGVVAEIKARRGIHASRQVIPAPGLDPEVPGQLPVFVAYYAKLV